jgi:Protein of unknown function (DUF1761)
MSTTTNQTNWLAVAAAAVSGFIIGFLWYGVLFVKQWMAGNGITMDETQTKTFKNGIEMDASPMPFVFNILAMVLYAVVMNWLLRRANATTLKDGATIGGAIGLMSLVGVYINNMFAGTSSSLSMVDGSYIFVLFTVMGTILGGWQKKA